MQKVLILFFIISIFSCQNEPSNSNTEMPISIIPKPAKVEKGNGYFTLNKETKINSKLGNKAFEFLNLLVKNTSGYELKSGESTENVIEFIGFQDDVASNESYSLDIQESKIEIQAGGPQGVFYAIQTLRQLLPPDFEKSNAGKDSWLIPCVKIEDSPRFSYRGMHLDVGRHYFSVDFIKKYIDLLALFKMNRFHWHLTEDQGWRIEIKQYPKLAEISAFRKESVVGHNNDKPRKMDGKRYGGFYTQEEVKEVVKYAQDRFVTVIPEIELPGHSQAVLAAYPELACTEGPFEVATAWGVMEDVFCPKEETFEFLENVLTEVMELFPSKYIHIGGDECPKKRWEESAFCQDLIKKEGLKDEHELQSWFIQRIEKFLNSKGRKIIGWDEILEGGLAPDATVMSWRGVQGGIEAAKQKHDVIMTPTSFCYLDYYQSRNPNEPLAIGGYLPLEKVYSYDPIPEELTEEEAKHILGVQGNVWTEYIKTPEQCEYMAFPRGIAIAENGWTNFDQKDYDDFASRLANQLPRLEALEVNFAKHIFDVNYKITAAEGGGVALALSTRSKDCQVVFSDELDKNPVTLNLLETNPVIIKEPTRVRASTLCENLSTNNVLELFLNVNKASGKSIDWTTPPHKNYNLGGKMALVNSISASDTRFSDGEWLAWNGEDFEATIDLGELTDISMFKTRFYNANGPWVYLPKKVEVFVSEDGKDFKLVGEFADFDGVEASVKAVEIELKENSRFVKVKAHRYGIIPEGRPGGGNEAWLFVDEMMIF